MEAWAGAARRLRAEETLALAQSVYAAAAPLAAKEGGAVFERHQKRLIETINGRD